MAELKYDARRLKTSEERLNKVQQGFKAIGGEASTKEPQLGSSLLAIRSEERVTQDPEKAMEDAKRALELTPGLAGPSWTIALAFLKLGQVQQAREACERAQDANGSFNKDHMRLVTKELAAIPQEKKEPPKVEEVKIPDAREAKEAAPVEEKAAAKVAAKAPAKAAKTTAKATAKVPAKSAKSGEDLGKNEQKPADTPAEKPAAKTADEPAESGEKATSGEKADKSAKANPSKSASEKKLSRASSGLERAESTKKLKKSATAPAKNSKNSKAAAQVDVDHVDHDAQTTAAEVLSVSAVSAASPCVAAELSETGLIDMATSVVEPGWRSPMTSPHRKIVSL